MTRRPLRVLAIADTDSYVKWGAALLDRAPAEWSRELLVLDSTLRPSAAQLESALAGTAFASGGASPATVGDLADIRRRVSLDPPDVVMLTARGPVIKVVLRTVLAAAVAAGGRRPVFVSGLPGISIPATRRALAYRAQADLMVLHSRREVREFGELSERMGYPHRLALATLPFLPERDGGQSPAGGDVVFAAQAKVPETREERLALLGCLGEAARRAPWRRVVIKVRGLPGEPQTHAERFGYAELLPELDPPAPANLVVAAGPMAEHLAGAAALVTVSSTAAVEALAMGVPVIALDDFGVSDRLINTVFVGSGLLASSRELVTGRFRTPHPDWLDDNYFHGAQADDWADQVVELVALRDADALPLKRQPHGTLGGRLRHAWDRKQALGVADRSVSGRLALAVGIPARQTMRIARRLRARLRARALKADGSDLSAVAAQSAGEAGGVPSAATASQKPSGMGVAASAGSSSTRVRE